MILALVVRICATSISARGKPSKVVREVFMLTPCYRKISDIEKNDFIESHTESSTEPSAESSASRLSFWAMSSCSDCLESVPFAAGCEVGPEATVGACRSSILRPIEDLTRKGKTVDDGEFGDKLMVVKAAPRKRSTTLRGKRNPALSWTRWTAITTDQQTQ